MGKTYFVSGIDTDCGKTIATGLIAKFFHEQGVRIITQKLTQTGCSGISEDIESHRKLMGIPLLPEDKNGLTCPYVLKHPASPHLAAAIDHVDIDINRITDATAKLERLFDMVILEGAGGLFVPIKPDYLIIDHITKMDYPLILVTSAKVGSINHTLMSLELCNKYGVKVQAVIYNHFPNSDELIIADSRSIFEKYLDENFPNTPLFEIPKAEDLNFSLIKFEGII